jgi:hypothetical protein
MDDDLSTAAVASSRGPGTQRRAPVRRHGRRPGPRLERDSTSWPRRSEVRGTWRTSKFDGPTDWCDGHTEAAQGEVCLTSQARGGARAWTPATRSATTVAGSPAAGKRSCNSDLMARYRCHTGRATERESVPKFGGPLHLLGNGYGHAPSNGDDRAEGRVSDLDGCGEQLSNHVDRA